MGNSHKEQKNRNSNVSVLDMSLDSLNPQVVQNLDDSDNNIIKDLQESIKLPIENEIYESEEISFDDKEEEIKNYIYHYGDAPPPSDHYHVYRSKSCVNNKNISLYNAPKPQFKTFNEHISPFKLSTKNLGGSQRYNKKPNSIILDFQKNIMDNKSCNDNQNMAEDFFDGFILNSETERTTPNIEDLQDLQNCRKKMAIFRDSIDNKSEHSLDENEKIDDIFCEKNININKHKKNKLWVKHIKQQKLKSKLSNNLRISTCGKFEKSKTVRNPVFKDFKPVNDIDNDNLYILNILESAAKEKKLKKKQRYTANV